MTNPEAVERTLASARAAFAASASAARARVWAALHASGAALVPGVPAADARCDRSARARAVSALAPRAESIGAGQLQRARRAPKSRCPLVPRRAARTCLSHRALPQPVGDDRMVVRWSVGGIAPWLTYQLALSAESGNVS